MLDPFRVWIGRVYGPGYSLRSNPWLQMLEAFGLSFQRCVATPLNGLGLRFAYVGLWSVFQLYVVAEGCTETAVAQEARVCEYADPWHPVSIA
jgi:hypothetical protein